MKHKKIIQINKDITIWSAPMNYIVKKRLPKKKKSKRYQYERSYFPTLLMCLEEVYKNLLKDELEKKEVEAIEEIKQIYLDTQQEIKTLLEAHTEAFEGGKD